MNKNRHSSGLHQRFNEQAIETEVGLGSIQDFYNFINSEPRESTRSRSSEERSYGRLARIHERQPKAYLIQDQEFTDMHNMLEAGRAVDHVFDAYTVAVEGLHHYMEKMDRLNIVTIYDGAEPAKTAWEYVSEA